jgi:hypothetical protein
MKQADQWELGADERERAADERERVADERDALADEREQLADRHDRNLDKDESELRLAMEPADPTTSAALQDAVRRAQAGVQRAEAELHRLRRAAAAIEARAGLRRSATDRTEAAGRTAAAPDEEELAWLLDRRDFVAVERDVIADAREALADQRDHAAGTRERLADERERASLDRAQRIDRAQRAGRHRADAPAPDTTEAARDRATTDRRATAASRLSESERHGPQLYGPMLLASFGKLARELFGTEHLSDSLRQVLKFTVEAVAGCDSACVTLWRQGHLVGGASTDAVAAELDDLQFGTGLGPALEALQSEEPVVVARLAESRRWPVLAATAGQLGMASAVCHGLFVHRPAQWSALGTFTLYSRTPDAFSDDDHEFGAILAAYLSVAIATADSRDEVDRREAALHRGLSTRDVIGQAKGILMERRHLSAGEAFDVLRRASQTLNRKIAEVARHLAETGELPD